ncbi:hypothetical protein KIPB_010039 [Kipferlia bialata]|uniref:Uncharacterized protein n=1 Tax=Kipferlia bialata TaxID=797122 RepID=A0A9K3D345_9EUKA|nr:hypothetical protein KIPB_010039 [Kipferlia bialata]|eukprot:g10039.t1
MPTAAFDDSIVTLYLGDSYSGFGVADMCKPTIITGQSLWPGSFFPTSQYSVPTELFYEDRGDDWIPTKMGVEAKQRASMTRWPSGMHVTHFMGHLWGLDQPETPMPPGVDASQAAEDYIRLLWEFVTTSGIGSVTPMGLAKGGQMWYILPVPAGVSILYIYLQYI